MTTLIAHYGLPLVALIIFAGEMGIPTLVPGEIGLLVAGNQAIHSIPMLLGAVALFGAVDLLATTTIHTVARTGGNGLLVRVLNRICRGKRSPDAMIARCRRRLGGRDSLVVFLTRLVPLFRLYASIGSGLIRVKFRHFLAGAAPAAWLWASIPLTAGYLLRSHLGDVVAQYPSMMRYVILGSVSVTVLIALVAWHRGRGAASRIHRGFPSAEKTA